MRERLRTIGWYAYAIPAAILVIVGFPLALGYGAAWLDDVLPEWNGDAEWLGWTLLLLAGGWIGAQWYARK